jgi:hypothetical protein
MDVTIFAVDAHLIMTFESSQFNSPGSQLSVALAGAAIFKGWVGAAKLFLNEEAFFWRYFCIPTIFMLINSQIFHKFS